MTDDELAEKASRIISDMCKGGRWRMCIPVQSDDSDIVLSRVVRRFNELRASSPSRDSGALHAAASDLRHVASGGTCAPETLRAHADALLTLERDAARMRKAIATQAETIRLYANYAERDGSTLQDVLDFAKARRAALTPSGEPTTTPETSDG